jgi:hypothetical protein
MKFSILLPLLLIAGFAQANTVPAGAFVLEKGTMGCPVHLELSPKSSCQGFTMRERFDKIETDLCNVNMGKFIKRWSEEGLQFHDESKATQQSNLLLLTKVVRVKKDKTILRESRTDLTLFFRAGRLDYQKTTDKKSLSCLYGRDPGLSLTATTGKD